MKILQLVQKPQRRGAEIFASQLSKELRHQEHVVRTAYLYSYNNPRALTLEPSDYQLSGDENHWLEKVPGAHPGLLKRLKKIVHEFEPDVVQVNGARTIKYGAFVKRLDDSPRWRLVYRNIDNPAYWVTDPLRRWFYRQ